MTDESWPQSRYPHLTDTQCARVEALHVAQHYLAKPGDPALTQDVLVPLADWVLVGHKADSYSWIPESETFRYDNHNAA